MVVFYDKSFLNGEMGTGLVETVLGGFRETLRFDVGRDFRKESVEVESSKEKIKHEEKIKRESLGF